MLDGAVRAALLHTDGDVLAATMGPRPALFRLAADTGEVVRRTAFALTDGPERGILHLHGGPEAGQTVVGMAHGRVWVLGSDGSVIAQHEMPGAIRVVGVRTDPPRVLAGDSTGRMHCLAP